MSRENAKALITRYIRGVTDWLKGLFSKKDAP